MKSYIYRSLLAFIFVLICAKSMAQVTIAPTNLFIDERTKFGTYLVINGSSESQEISVDFIFGYSQTNEEGIRRIVYDDEQLAEIHSAAGWVRAFPKNFTLAPGQRQIVRLRVVSPNEIDDGTYWSRIKTTSSPVSTPVEVQSNDAVTARVGIKIEQVTGLYYKKGNVETGIDISGLKTKIGEDQVLEIYADLLRTGNSPFLGSITATVTDSQNKVVETSFISTTIFFDGIHKQEINISNLDPGNYTVELKFESRRSDISSSDIIPIQPVSRSVGFSIN